MTTFRYRFVHRFRDRHGRLRHYFRRPGFKSVALPGAPGSTEFKAAYDAALAGDTAPKIHVGEGRLRQGTIGALVSTYLASAAFRTLSPNTQATYRGIIERFRAEHAAGPVAGLSVSTSQSCLPARRQRQRPQTTGCEWSGCSCS
jgi:hypothetical protein